MDADDPIIVFRADPQWTEEFRAIGTTLRRALGPLAARIDHVGSTSVPGLDAKPIIDIQISVAQLEPVLRYAPALEALGYSFRPENPDRSKRFFRRHEGPRGVHIHVRRSGSVDEQLTLLLRDYLRTHPTDADGYARVKWKLAEVHRNDRERYVDAKSPTVWALLRKADEWSQATGWEPGPSDA